MNRIHCIYFASVLLAGANAPANAQPRDTVRDLESLFPVALTRQDLLSLLPGAKITRAVSSGNIHTWTNDADGTFIVSSDNRAVSSSRPTTGRGKWHVSEDGRYCVLIQWRASSDEWCRFVIRTNDGYYMTKAMTPANEKVYKFEVSR